VSQAGKDKWVDGAKYEPYVGRWSRLVAVDFLDWLGIPPGQQWLDVGCGTGALTQAVLTSYQPAHIVGVDRSHSIAAYATQTTADARAVFCAGDAQAIPLPSASRDVVVSGLVLNFVPDQPRAVTEMKRVLRPGGTAALYVWDYAGDMQLMRYFWDASAALDPRGIEVDEGKRFPICKPEPLRALFESAGLAEVETRAIDVPTVFRDFDDYWSPFLSGQAPAPHYAMSLSEEQRAELREHLRRTLPTAADGTISLIARAWAVRGTKPG
jgi:ubiquinone/menaquinone biosynthesis C-methylase UbiE